MNNDFVDALNKTLNTIAREDGFIMPTRTASWRYYRSQNTANASRAKDKYFWTTEKTDYYGWQRYRSGVYRYNGTTKRWTARKVATHAKKRDAIARAGKLWRANA